MCNSGGTASSSRPEVVYGALYFFVNNFLYMKGMFNYEMDGFKRNQRKVSRIF